MKKSSMLFLIFGILVAAGLCFVTKNSVQVISQSENNKITIAIDAGHGGFDGGFDPSPAGIFSLKEKDINLAIANKTKSYLEKKGYRVVMTRTGDYGLYEETDTHKKRADMKKRVDIINSNDVKVAVSIHQNSFSDKASHGAQVFYYTGSDEGERLAHTMQEFLVNKLPVENTRKEKANSEYYMLKKVSCPIVIVECGFLSNPEEAEKLNTEEYQDLVAQTIAEGIENYLLKPTSQNSFDS